MIKSEVLPEIAECKRAITEAVSEALRTLQQQTGLAPCDIDIRMIETTTVGDSVKRFALGDVSVRFRL